MSTSTPSARGRFLRELSFLLRGLPVGVVALTVAVTGFALGLGTLVIVCGIPVLAGTLRAARGMARVERRELEALAGHPLPPHHYRAPAGTGFARLTRSLAEPQSWRDLAHMVLSFPLRVVSFCLAVVWTVGGAGGLLYMAWAWTLPRGDDNQGLFELITGNDSFAADVAVTTAAGAFLLVTALPVVRALAALHRSLASALLTNRTAAHRAAMATAGGSAATGNGGSAGTSAGAASGGDTAPLPTERLTSAL